MSFPRYLKYKASGVEWLGDVPEHWEVKKMKHLATRIASGKTPLGGSEIYVDEGVLFLRSQNVYDEGLRLEDVVRISTAVDIQMSVSRAFPQDILLNVTGASIGRSCVVPSDFPPANVNQHVCVIRLSAVDQVPFVGLFFKSMPVKTQVDHAQNGAAREGLNFDQIGNMSIALPPVREQITIAAFLDHETAKIDELVAEQERLIELLKEKRQAVISHAVTKGLNPDAPMKDSGIEWLGEVPLGWEVLQLKHLTISIEQGWSPQCDGRPVETDEEWGVLKVGCVNGGAFRPSENKHLPLEMEPIPALGICKGDLLISRANTRELVGSAAVAELDYPNLLLCDKLYRLRFNSERCLPEFVCCYLGSQSVRRQIELGATGASSSMLNIPQSAILELKFGAPTLKEQREILAFLDTKLLKFTTLTTEANRVIDLLKERRTALISAAVTGQIDVRNLVPVESV